MSKKYSLQEIKDSLENLYKKLEEKGREDGFWVIASRSDFKPIKVEETVKGKKVSKTIVSIKDIKTDVLEGKEQYFRNKKLAYVHFFINNVIYDNPKEYNEKNLEKIKDDILSSITITIYIIDSDGKINTKEKNKWECRVNFTIEDLTKHKLKFSDAEVIMRQVADKLVTTVSFSGINFKDYINKLKKLKKNKYTN